MKTILVVEDSPGQRAMIVNLLKNQFKKSGMKVMEAGGGSEALDLIKVQCPDLVLLDIIMPKPNGYDVCRKIKGDPATQHIPVVMCSCKAEEFDRHWGLKVGADAYIAKPFPPDELVDVVKQLLPTD